MVKRQVIQYNPNGEFKQNIVGIDQNYANQQVATTYGTINGPHRQYEVKDNFEDEEQIQKMKDDDQNKFNSRNPIEYQNELQVQEILEKKAKQQLQNLCGSWDQSIRKRIMLELDIIPEPLLALFKWLIIFTLVDLLWVTFSSLCMPTAGMHFIEGYVTTNLRWQMFIYWFSNIFQWLFLTLMFAKLTIFMCRAAIIAILLNLAWHVANFVFYYSFNSSRQDKFPISNPVIYWVENFISLVLFSLSVIMYSKIDKFVKTNPDRALVLNKNMADVIKEQYLINNPQNNLPIRQIGDQQGGIVQGMSQQYMQVYENTAVIDGQSAAGITLQKSHYPISNGSQYIIQNDLTQYNNNLSRRELGIKANQSILNETDTNFLNQTNGNINYTGLYSQQFLDQDKSLIIDEIQNERTAVWSIYHHDWRTHYGEFAPDQKKRKILDPFMVKQLEEDLKVSRKMKIQGNVPQMYTYYDLHFVKQNPLSKSTIQNSPTKSQVSPTKSQISPNLSNINRIYTFGDPNQQTNELDQNTLQVQAQTQQQFTQVQQQQYQQQQQQLQKQQNTGQNYQQMNIQQNQRTLSNFSQPQRDIENPNGQSQSNFQSQYQTPNTQSPNIQYIKSRGQSLSFYGEASLGYNQRQKKISQIEQQQQDQQFKLDHSASSQMYSKTQNQFSRNEDNDNQNNSQLRQKRMSSFNQDDYESEYFKTKALIGDLNSNKKRRWGVSNKQEKQQNIKTFENIN